MAIDDGTSINAVDAHRLYNAYERLFIIKTIFKMKDSSRLSIKYREASDRNVGNHLHSRMEACIESENTIQNPRMI